MKKISRIAQLSQIAALWAAAILPVAALAAPDQGYITNNIASSVPGIAPHSDGRIVNPWGTAEDASRLFVAENGAGLITIHSLSGVPTHSAILVPPGAGSSNSVGTPTGVVINSTNGFFITNSTRRIRSIILYATEDGTIGGWNQSIKATNGIIAVDNSGAGAVYKSLALGHASNGTFLFAANFAAGTIEKYDSNFALLQSFSDPTLTASNFAPFGMKIIQQKLFVTFAKVAAGGHDDEPGVGNGFVDIFNLDGTLVRSFTDAGELNSPWGLALAPTHFGKFSGNVLVGNFGDGRILAYNLVTGEFLGPLQDSTGNDLVIPGLWSLDFEHDPLGVNYDYEASKLLFTAGIQSEAAGLIGTLHAAAPSQAPVR